MTRGTGIAPRYPSTTRAEVSNGARELPIVSTFTDKDAHAGIVCSMKTEIDAYCSMQSSPRTRQEYRKDLDRWFEAGLPLSVDGAAAYKRYLESNFKEASAGRFWSTVRTFYRWLVNRGLLETSPFEVIKAPARRRNKIIESPSDAAVNLLVASCESPRDRAVVELLLCGLRASEVTDLTADSVKFTPGYGYYLHVLGKGNKERVVPISDSVVDKINDLGNVGSDWLVHQKDGSKLTYDTVNGLVDSAARRAGVKIYPHMLRHHYGTRMVRAGANVIVLSKLLGHSTVATTERYVTMDLSDLVEASRLDPRNNGGIHLVPHLEATASPDATSGRRNADQLASVAVR